MHTFLESEKREFVKHNKKHKKILNLRSFELKGLTKKKKYIKKHQEQVSKQMDKKIKLAFMKSSYALFFCFFQLALAENQALYSVLDKYKKNQGITMKLKVKRKSFLVNENSQSFALVFYKKGNMCIFFPEKEMQLQYLNKKLSFKRFGKAEQLNLNSVFYHKLLNKQDLKSFFKIISKRKKGRAWIFNLQHKQKKHKEKIELKIDAGFLKQIKILVKDEYEELYSFSSITLGEKLSVQKCKVFEK